jgi:ABC-type transport system substrate-binding protein
MEDNKLKFVVHGRKDGDKFILEGIMNFILQNLDPFDDKTIIVTFEKPITDTIQLDSGNLFN